MNDRVVMGVHSRRCARCLVAMPELSEMSRLRSGRSTLDAATFDA
jgi:hypothetical protein